MTDAEDLGCGERRLDLITLCSVFTHLGPDDFRTMLHLVRRYVEPDGTLFFTVFIDELTVGGHGLADHLDRKLGGGGTDAPLELRQVLRPVSPYTDLDPEQPLAYALYSRAHVLDLVDGTGWAIEELRDPVEHAQHHLICTPA
jgi:hypothetical protein